MDGPCNNAHDLPASSVPPSPIVGNWAGMAPGQYQKRPKSVTAIGKDFLISAGIWLLFLLHAFHSLAVNQWAWPIVNLVFVTAESIIGIHVLRMTHWSREAAIIWLICTIGLVFGSSAIALTRWSLLEPDCPGIALSIAVSIDGLMFVSILSIIIMGIMIYCLSRSDIIAAFESNNQSHGWLPDTHPDGSDINRV